MQVNIPYIDNMVVSTNGGYPLFIHFKRIFHYKPSIVGYPHDPPCMETPIWIHNIMGFINNWSSAPSENTSFWLPTPFWRAELPTKRGVANHLVPRWVCTKLLNQWTTHVGSFLRYSQWKRVIEKMPGTIHVKSDNTDICAYLCISQAAKVSLPLNKGGDVPFGHQRRVARKKPCPVHWRQLKLIPCHWPPICFFSQNWGAPTWLYTVLFSVCKNTHFGWFWGPPLSESSNWIPECGCQNQEIYP